MKKYAITRLATPPENSAANKIAVQPRKSLRGNVYVQHSEGVASAKHVKMQFTTSRIFLCNNKGQPLKHVSWILSKVDTTTPLSRRPY